MTIHIESLTFDAIIGILDFERVTPQKVIIDMEIDYEYTEKTFINYVDIIETVQGLMKKNQY
ncbi:MAG: dihydroneopterin aldolase, partial [Epsilonproteobacteria bacterium]|nr:dihydroneopterin aldolase [Campylobacterota bacterium]